MSETIRAVCPRCGSVQAVLRTSDPLAFWAHGTCINVPAVGAALAEVTESITEVLYGTGVAANTWQSAARRLADEVRRLRSHLGYATHPAATDGTR